MTSRNASPRKASQPLVSAIEHLYKKLPDATVAEVATALGASYDRVSKLIFRYELKPARRPGRTKLGVYQALRKDRHRSYASIGEELGVSRQRVEQLAKALGLVQPGERYTRHWRRQCRRCDAQFLSRRRMAYCEPCRTVRCAYCARAIRLSQMFDGARIPKYCSREHYHAASRRKISD